MKFNRKRIASLNEISLTPLIDTTLVLLVIFMVATPIVHNSLKVDLPKGQVQEDRSNCDELVVTIDSKEQLFFNNEKVDFSQLLEKIIEKVGSRQGLTVKVEGDQEISYRILVRVVDHIKQIAGIEHVVLSTQKG